MRRLRSDLLGGSAVANCYHVVSRVVGRELVFGDLEKEKFWQIVERQLMFSGLECLAWCVMGNHFHLLLRVPERESALEGWTEEDMITRPEILAGESYTDELLKKVEMWRRNGCEQLVSELADRVRSRLFDLSSFMKEVKQTFSAWFNLTRGRTGTLWEERFRSLLVEGTGGSSADGISALLAVAAYIDLNPVRAGIVDDPKDYRWCSYAAAVAGKKTARAGLGRCIGLSEREKWRRVGAAYRKVLFAAGEEVGGGETVGSCGRSGRRGFSQSEIEAVWKAGGELSLATMLRCRVAYFTQGIAIGGTEFLRAFGKRHGGKNRLARELEGVERSAVKIWGSRLSNSDAIRAPG